MMRCARILVMKNMVLKLRFNKKGISNIVATLLLIFLTVIAITIVSTFAVTLISDRLEGTTCFDYRNYFSFETEYGYACHTDDRYAVSVRNSGSNEGQDPPIGFLLVLTGEDSTRRTIEIIDGAPTISNSIYMLNDSITDFELPREGEVRTYVYETDSSFPIDSVEIYPILSSEQTCTDVNDMATVSVECTGDRPL